MRRLGYVPALDGLRGIAIALVVAVHLAGFPIGGAVGVDLFFVLSGFLITTLLGEERGATGAVSMMSFYKRRARRLFPALAVLLIAYPVFAEVKTGSLGLRAIAAGGFYTANIAQAFFKSNPVTGSGLAQLWSLAEEEQFYFLWPAMFLIVARSRHAIRYLATILALLILYRAGLALGGASHTRLDLAPDTHADGLLAGCILAFVRQRRTGFSVPESVGQLGVCILAVFAVLRPNVGTAGVIYDATALPALELGCICLLLAALSQTALAQGLSTRPLVALGKISYSLYLWHYLIGWAFDWHQPLLTIPLSFAAAIASYRLVEQPFRRRHHAIENNPDALKTTLMSPPFGVKLATSKMSSTTDVASLPVSL